MGTHKHEGTCPRVWKTQRQCIGLLPKPTDGQIGDGCLFTGCQCHVYRRKANLVNLNICGAPLSIFQSTWILQHTVLPAHKPHLPLLPRCRASPPLGWYSFYSPMEGRRLSIWVAGWLSAEIKCRPRESNPDTVTHPSTD